MCRTRNGQTLNIRAPEGGVAAGEYTGSKLVNSSEKLLTSVSLRIDGRNGGVTFRRARASQSRPYVIENKKVADHASHKNEPFILKVVKTLDSISSPYRMGVP